MYKFTGSNLAEDTNILSSLMRTVKITTPAHLSWVELGSHLKCWRDLELVDEVKRNHYHRVAAEKNEVQKQLQTSQISDKTWEHAEITNAGSLP